MDIQKKRYMTSQTGFTIVELLIATTIFTMVLLIASYAIVHVGKLYYKGLITGRTQDMARQFGDEISQTIQFGPQCDTVQCFMRENTAGVPFSSGTQNITVRSRCLGSNRYSYVLEKPMGTGSLEARHVLWRDRVPDDYLTCAPLDLTQVTPSDTFTLSPGADLLASKMRIPVFNVTGGSLWNIEFVISHGDSVDLFEAATASVPAFTRCVGIRASGQFCAVAGYSTTVTKRL
jgi:prepilin-type N-terminal cleavage/methylation domain-containing protein